MTAGARIAIVAAESDFSISLRRNAISFCLRCMAGEVKNMKECLPLTSVISKAFI